jgi:hypothetical protein
MIVSDTYTGIKKALAGRTASDADMAEAVRKGVLELSEGYKFPDLETTGPVVSLTQFLTNYDTSIFTQVADGDIELNMVNSFFIYFGSFAPPTSSSSTGNSGYNLVYRDIRNIELLLNVPGTPKFWSRHNGQVWIASMPDKAYQIYMRYQHEHPFPNAGTADAGLDDLLLPNSWQDIVEYQGAMRLAQNLNLSSKASELQARLYGDNQFQTSDGIAGTPGLIFQRTSQKQRDQGTAMRSMRLRMGRR